MASTKSLKAIDLFSGCGGLTSGLKHAGFHVEAAVELNHKARETYSSNHPEVWIAADDVRFADPDKILKILKLASGELDLLAGCPPCQGFSRIRKRNRAHHVPDERNDLIVEFERFVRAMRPKFVMMENVPDVINYHKFDDFLNGIGEIGYNCTFQILDVADFGVAQRRRRLVLVASRVCRPVLSEGKESRISVRDVLANIGSAGASGDELHDLPQKRSDRIARLISAIPKDGGSRSDLPKELQLDCHRRLKGFYDVYGRMKWDSVAPTITGGCYNPSKGRFLHPEEDRAITLREAAILQGFPPDYVFNVRHGRESISLMIGNALPPPFIAAHAKEIAKSITDLTR